MTFNKNEGLLDRSIRILIGEILFIAGYFWSGGPLQTLLITLALIILFTAFSGFCAIYRIFGWNTLNFPAKPFPKTVSYLIIALLVVLPFVSSYYSIFFTKKFFLEDYNRMNNFYKQTLFNTGQNKRPESIENYEKLSSEYGHFYAKYSAFRPFVLKYDNKFGEDLLHVKEMIAAAGTKVYDGDLPKLHTELESIRPIFQEILKRNNFSMLGVALVDFHDAMEKVIAASDQKDAGGVIAVYPEIDEKLKAVETEANDSEIQVIRKNLEDLLTLAKTGKNDDLAKKAAELKSSFVKVYLKRG